MLRGTLIHPEIMGAVAAAGHGSRILIADANFPASTKSDPSAKIVYLGLRPGLPSATDVLRVLKDVVPIQAAGVMEPEDGREYDIFTEFREILDGDTQLAKIDRRRFYEQAAARDTAVIIVTGEQRLFGNLLITVGVVEPS